MAVQQARLQEWPIILPAGLPAFRRSRVTSNVRPHEEPPLTNNQPKKKRCSCNGENERCYRCGGSGSYDVVWEGQRTLPDPRELEFVSKAASPRKGALAPPLLTPPLLRCPTCKKKFIGLSAHMLAKHGYSLADYKASLPPPPPINPEELVECPDCSKLLPYRRLFEHLRVIHTKPTAHSSVPAGTPDGGAPRGHSPAQERQERLMDATRDYYAAYRDQGKFGSHSSHDDYGDESQS